MRTERRGRSPSTTRKKARRAANRPPPPRCSKTVVTTQETRFHLSCREPEERTPAQWLHLVRGHWAGVESPNHWRRDHLWREDGLRTNKADALANLALLRNAPPIRTPVPCPDVPLKEIVERLHSEPAACLRVIC